MTYAKIHTTGCYLPAKSLTNDDLASRLDTSHAWIYERTGIASRHIANEQETTSYMASMAARDCLKKSGLAADDIDMIIVATCTPDQFFPSMACHVQHALGCKRPIPAMDITAACSGFLYILDVASQYIMTGKAKHIMLVGSESMSRAVDWTDRSTCILFGDGAGAAIVSASEQAGILGSQLHAQYDVAGLLRYVNGSNADAGSFISMKGNDVFKLAVTHMGNIVDEILQAHNLRKSDIKWLVPHQANSRIIQAIAKRLAMPMSQVILTIAEQGNTSAASIPLALNYAFDRQIIQRGDLILMESFGGGMTWGAMLLHY
ncbi:MAG: ketoacyl-ACP synthase III [Legionellaceae bacterium]|nr:ketoacyl-ACP synthase III [Legionellaceae bacterium]